MMDISSEDMRNAIYTALESPTKRNFQAVRKQIKQSDNVHDLMIVGLFYRMLVERITQLEKRKQKKIKK